MSDSPYSEQILELWESPETELQQLVGGAVTRAGSSLDPKVLIESGRLWVEENLDQIRARVCSDPAVLVALENDDSDGIVVAAAVADIVAALVELPAVAALTVLLCRYGIDKLCG